MSKDLLFDEDDGIEWPDEDEDEVGDDDLEPTEEELKKLEEEENGELPESEL